MKKLLCFGHRGARGHEPENTVRSIRKALELGVDGVEIDVYFVDGHLMVIHDATLKRTTNGHGWITTKTFEYLRTLDAGCGERIPTLAEIFDAVNRRGVINIELKGPKTAAPVARLIEDYVHNHGWSYDDFLVSSFRHERLRKIKNICPEIRTGALVNRRPRSMTRLVRDLGAWSIHPNVKCVTSALVETAHKNGLKVIVFTVNQPDEIERMRRLNVDGVFTDFPERVAGVAPEKL